MRVAFVNSLYPPWSNGGAESTLRGLAEGLVDRGVDVDLYCLTPETPQRTIMGPLPSRPDGNLALDGDAAAVRPFGLPASGGL